MKLRRALVRVAANCRFRHRFSCWSAVLQEMDEDWTYSIRPDRQFRMCERCGTEEIRERVCV